VYGKPIKINSGYRCPEHNADVKGRPLSYHLSGQAADIAFPGNQSLSEAAHLLHFVKVLFPYPYLGTSFVHVDIREESV